MLMIFIALSFIWMNVRVTKDFKSLINILISQDSELASLMLIGGTVKIQPSYLTCHMWPQHNAHLEKEPPYSVTTQPMLIWHRRKYDDRFCCWRCMVGCLGLCVLVYMCGWVYQCVCVCVRINQRSGVCVSGVGISHSMGLYRGQSQPPCTPVTPVSVTPVSCPGAGWSPPCEKARLNYRRGGSPWRAYLWN